MNRDIPMTKEADVRETPDSLYLPLEREFKFDLDACATHANARCPLYFTEDGMWAKPVADGLVIPGEPGMMDDRHGLTGSWKGRRVWCNPPFSDIESWVLKAWTSEANLVCMLVPATRTEQGWWHDLIEPYRDGFGGPDGSNLLLATRFLRGRTHFLENGQPILRKNKDGTLYINPKSGKPEVSSPKFGCVLLIWQ